MSRIDYRFAKNYSFTKYIYWCQKSDCAKVWEKHQIFELFMSELGLVSVKWVKILYYIAALEHIIHTHFKLLLFPRYIFPWNRQINFETRLECYCSFDIAKFCKLVANIQSNLRHLKNLKISFQLPCVQVLKKSTNGNKIMHTWKLKESLMSLLPSYYLFKRVWYIVNLSPYPFTYRHFPLFSYPIFVNSYYRVEWKYSLIQ